MVALLAYLLGPPAITGGRVLAKWVELLEPPIPQRHLEAIDPDAPVRASETHAAPAPRMAAGQLPTLQGEFRSFGGDPQS
jgi:hypothetical protein